MERQIEAVREALRRVEELEEVLKDDYSEERMPEAERKVHQFVDALQAMHTAGNATGVQFPADLLSFINDEKTANPEAYTRRLTEMAVESGRSLAERKQSLEEISKVLR